MSEREESPLTPRDTGDDNDSDFEAAPVRASYHLMEDEMPIGRRAARRPRGSYLPPRSDDDEDAPRPARKRGRPPKNKSRDSVGPPSTRERELNLEPAFPIVDDEYVSDAADPAGETKVDALGYLNGGREYRCRTFTKAGRGNRLYMLSTEPARCMGYRDSYMLFLKHRRLYKIMVQEDEKQDLIDRNIIPASYRGRTVGLVTARSIFREFGAKIIVGGRKVVDDYWEHDARLNGDVEGELADPEDKLPPPGMPYNRNQYVAWFGASSVYHTGTSDLPRKRKKAAVVTDENWLLEHASATSRYNAELTLERKLKWNTGYYEPHTNLLFFPAISQPQRARWTRLADARQSPCPRLDTRMVVRPDEGFDVHLRNVPESILQGLEPSMLAAIRARQQHERQQEWPGTERDWCLRDKELDK